MWIIDHSFYFEGLSSILRSSESINVDVQDLRAFAQFELSITDTVTFQTFIGRPELFIHSRHAVFEFDGVLTLAFKAGGDGYRPEHGEHRVIGDVVALRTSIFPIGLT